LEAQAEEHLFKAHVSADRQHKRKKSFKGQQRFTQEINPLYREVWFNR
jgi:hypothetical protein